MSNKEIYTQVKLVKGNVTEVSWIPDKYAVIGKTLKIQEDGVWTNGWQVMGVYSSKTKDEIIVAERVHTKIRKTSDVEKGTFSKRLEIK